MMTGGNPGVALPSFANVLMPVGRLNTFIESNGINLGWMKGHICPCTQTGEAQGTPRQECQTCYRRGTYWDGPPTKFIGFITYMHTSSAPDEPGSLVDSTIGALDRAEPTLTIPSSALTVWQQSGEMDAYVEYDATTRRQSALKVGDNPTLPYPFNAAVASVTVWNSSTFKVAQVPVLPANAAAGAQGYTFSAGTVTLSGFPRGTAYTVEYSSSPVYVAFRRSGGLPHRRPFGQGQKLPLRYHVADLDLWTRARFGADGPQGMSNVVVGS